jgi:hypothetical protein
MTTFTSPEEFLAYLRNEEGLEAYFSGECDGCRLVSAYLGDNEGRHHWHEPGCKRVADRRRLRNSELGYWLRADRWMP